MTMEVLYGKQFVFFFVFVEKINEENINLRENNKEIGTRENKKVMAILCTLVLIIT